MSFKSSRWYWATALQSLTFVLLLLAPTCSQAQQASDRANEKSALQVDTILEWFPADTETVIVAQGPFEIAVLGEDHEPKSLEDAFQRLCTGMLQHVRDADARSKVDGLNVELAVTASRHFRWPKSLGALPFEGCEVIAVAEKDQHQLQTAMRNLLELAPSSIDVAGNKAALFKEKWEQDTWTVYYCVPRPGILLCATNESFLSDTIRRMVGKQEKRALPKDLPEWKELNSKARCWAIRHFDKTQPELDPSSPLNERSAGYKDAKAVGMAVWCEPEVTDRLVVHYLTNNDDALPKINDRWNSPSDKLNTVVDWLKAGVIEIVHDSADAEERNVGLLTLLWYLGHGVVI